MPPVNNTLIITGPEEHLLCILDKYQWSSPRFADLERATESVRANGCLEMSYLCDRVHGERVTNISATYKRVTVAQIAEVHCLQEHWLRIWALGTLEFGHYMAGSSPCPKERIRIKEELRALAIKFILYTGRSVVVSDAESWWRFRG